jgi:hypothetical protein
LLELLERADEASLSSRLPGRLDDRPQRRVRGHSGNDVGDVPLAVDAIGERPDGEDLVARRDLDEAELSASMTSRISGFSA